LALEISAERTARLAKKIFRHIDGATTDRLPNIKTFRASIYVDPELAKLERRRIFATCPIALAHGSEVPNPGDFITMQANEHDVLIARRRDRTVGVYVNSCRHRGATLVAEPCGNRKTFTCPYHGWTYGADGELRSISFSDTYGDVVRAENGLIALPSEERHGFIWIVEDPEATIDVASFLGPEIDMLLSESGLGQYTCAKSEVLELPQNWKIMADGLLDGYHVKFLHGATISPYMHDNIMAVDVFGRHAFHATPRRRISEIADKTPGTTPLNRYCIFSLALAPNSQLTSHPDHTEFWTFLQDRQQATKCRALLRILTPEPLKDEAARQIMEKNYKILVDAVKNEDIPAGNGVQRSSAMPAVKTVQLGRNEVLNQLFHANYEHLMAGGRWEGLSQSHVTEGDDLSFTAAAAAPAGGGGSRSELAPGANRSASGGPLSSQLERDHPAA
jgi:phenylpropionate dioxygenase-like ring-hydroxylating dioxygenase large terminal subunit